MVQAVVFVTLLSLAAQASALRVYAKKAKPAEVGSRNVTFKYYVINLEKRQDRLHAFQKSVQPSMKDHICRVTGVEGSKLKETDFAEGGKYSGKAQKNVVSKLHQKSRAAWDDVNEGAVGTYLSHTAAYAQILKDDVDVGIVMEDDNLHWSPTYEKDLKRMILNPSKQDFDFIQMSYCTEEGTLLREEAVMGSHSVRKSGGKPCLGASAVSRRGAQRLIQKGWAFPIDRAVDSQVTRLNWGAHKEFAIYHAVPMMGMKQEMGSDVQTTNDKYAKPKNAKPNAKIAELKKADEKSEYKIPSCA